VGGSHSIIKPPTEIYKKKTEKFMDRGYEGRMLNRAGLGSGCDFLSAVERPAQKPGRMLIAVILSE
jgi:hypothetical protein